MEAVEILGVRVGAWTWAGLTAALDDRLATRTATTVMYANVHVVNTAQQDPALAAALAAADVVYCDGAGVRLGARLLGEALPPRLTGADFIDDLAAWLAARGATLYWLGGAAGVAAAATRQLVARHPRLRVAGAHHGFFDPTGPASDVVVEAINASAADVVLVGLGTPAQERWVARNRARLRATVVWCLGATADFVVGAQRRGPAVLRRLGLEWLGRLAHDPRRLAGRYLLGNPRFLARVVRARVRGSAR